MTMNVGERFVESRQVNLRSEICKLASERVNYVSKHLERDLEALEQELLVMSSLVEQMIDKAWRALTGRDQELGAEVISADANIDQREVRIEEECLKILALHQPVAIDLRRVASILKINNDLERIADMAVNIAERGKRVIADFHLPETLSSMAEAARSMLRETLNAFVDLDCEAAYRVCESDDTVDRDHAEVMTWLYDLMRSNPDMIGPSIHCLAVARSLERIADHATNIAEDVIYLVKGDIARHRHSEIQPGTSGKRSRSAVTE
jgi:phosphate transport system protein